MAVNGRRKGRRFELTVAKILGAWWGCDFRRVPMSGGWQKTEVSGDVMRVRRKEGEADNALPFPFSVECKACEDPWSLELLLSNPGGSLLARWLQQAWRDAEAHGRGVVPMLVAKRSRHPVLVFVPVGTGNKARTVATFHRETGVPVQVEVHLLDDLVKLTPSEILRNLGRG